MKPKRRHPAPKKSSASLVIAVSLALIAAAGVGAYLGTLGDGEPGASAGKAASPTPRAADGSPRDGLTREERIEERAKRWALAAVEPTASGLARAGVPLSDKQVSGVVARELATQRRASRLLEDLFDLCQAKASEVSESVDVYHQALDEAWPSIASASARGMDQADKAWVYVAPRVQAVKRARASQDRLQQAAEDLRREGR